MESILGIVFILSGYTNGAELSIGAGFHDIEPDHCTGPSYRIVCTRNDIGPDPLGIIRLSTSPAKNINLVATHISSVPDGNDGQGFNMVSVEYTIKIGGRH